MTILKSNLESTVTCADIHSGLAVLRFVADIIQIVALLPSSSWGSACSSTCLSLIFASRL